jgi:hypothetical protein
MYNIPETPDGKCFVKAINRGQRTFTVVEQDRTAVSTIAHWVYLNIHTAPPDKLHEAIDCCIAMRSFANKKAAD